MKVKDFLNTDPEVFLDKPETHKDDCLFPFIIVRANSINKQLLEKINQCKDFIEISMPLVNHGNNRKYFTIAIYYDENISLKTTVEESEKLPWQPMGTAPTDGTVICFIGKYYPKGNTEFEIKGFYEKGIHGWVDEKFNTFYPRGWRHCEVSN